MTTAVSIKAISGIILFVAGVLCISLPIMGALDVEAMLGIALLLSGIFHLVGTVDTKEAPDFIWSMLISFALLTFGLLLLANPFGGIELLATILFLFFLANAFFILGAALNQKECHQRWIWTLFASLLFFAMSMLTFFGLAGNDPWAISIVTGVTILGYSISLLVNTGVINTKITPKKR